MSSHIPQWLQLVHVTLRWPWWRFCCCGSAFTWRCCTRRTTRSTPTSRCCARTVGHVVPDMAFCPACGVATQAASRSSRKGRRESRPTSREPDEPTTDVTHPGYSVMPANLRRAAGAAHVRMPGCCGPGAPASWWSRSRSSACRSSSTSRPLATSARRTAGSHPPAKPVAVNPRFTAPDGSFSVSHPAPSPVVQDHREPERDTGRLPRRRRRHHAVDEPARQRTDRRRTSPKAL